MAMKKDCPKCQGSMSEGFIGDSKDGGGQRVSAWIEGAPEKRWYGLALRGKRRLEIVTYRCGRCGFLENYAPD